MPERVATDGNADPGSSSQARVLRLIGYWAEPDDTGWPDPADFVDHDRDPRVWQRVSVYLRAGTPFVAAAGLSQCRLCGITSGNTELTDGKHFIWPEGLVHYIEVHDVRLPDSITRLMTEPPPPIDPAAFERDVRETRLITIDIDWWRTASP